MSYTLLGQLFGVWNTTVHDAVLPLIPLLEARGITGPADPRIKTLTQLREHAAARNVTINSIPVMETSKTIAATRPRPPT